MTNSRTWSADEVEAICQDLQRRRQDKLALIGFPMSRCDTMTAVRIADTVLDGSTWQNLWLESSEFSMCSFIGADLSSLKDHGNRFTDCDFTDTRFRNAVLGYDGSVYRRCRFERADFSGSAFVRALFDGCEFVECHLDGVDFDACRFIATRFRGRVKDVWFRGSFRSAEFLERFGAPPGKPVLGADFREAELEGVSFGNGLDLSEIVLPATPGYFLYDRWPERLTEVRSSLAQVGDGARAEYEVFLRAFAPVGGQADMLVSEEDLARWFGKERADYLLTQLGHPTRASGA